MIITTTIIIEIMVRKYKNKPHKLSRTNLLSITYTKSLPILNKIKRMRNLLHIIQELLECFVCMYDLFIFREQMCSVDRFLVQPNEGHEQNIVFLINIIVII